MLEPQGLDLAVNLEIDTEHVLRRLAARRVCSDCGANYSVVDNPPRIRGICDVCGGEVVQRDDDTESAIRRRLELYERETAPLMNWFSERGLLVNVDALGSPDEVTDRLVGRGGPAQAGAVPAVGVGGRRRPGRGAAWGVVGAPVSGVVAGWAAGSILVFFTSYRCIRDQNRRLARLAGKCSALVAIAGGRAARRPHVGAGVGVAGASAAVVREAVARGVGLAALFWSFLHRIDVFETKLV